MMAWRVTRGRNGVDQHWLRRYKGWISFNQCRIRSGAMGLMQLIPQTAAGLGVKDPDPEQNIGGGVGIKDSWTFNGNLELALAAYNSGPGRIAGLGLTDLTDPEQMKNCQRKPRTIRKVKQYLNSMVWQGYKTAALTGCRLIMCKIFVCLFLRGKLSK